MNKYDLVKVRWLDAQTGFSTAMPISEFLEDFKPLYNYSFGYLLCNDKEKIILGFLLMDDGDEDPLIKHWQLIPKGMVKEIKKQYEPHAMVIRKNGKKEKIPYTLVNGNEFIIGDKKKLFKKATQKNTMEKKQ